MHKNRNKPPALSRRHLIQSSLSAILMGRTLLGKQTRFRLGITDWNLYKTADPDAIRLASQLGFEGVQVSFGHDIQNGKMPLDDPAKIKQYLALSKQYKMPLDGTCVDRLHNNSLKSDKLALQWVSDSIRLTKDLHTRVLPLPFFGHGALKTQAEMDYVGDALRELAPQAERANVILGLEDTISAEDNVRIMDRSRSKNVLVYYDVGNSTIAGFDPVKEIRWLGKSRICQIHLKDNPHFLGEGSINFPAVLKAMRDIGFDGYANLETDARKDAVAEDLKRNLSYLRQLLANS